MFFSGVVESQIVCQPSKVTLKNVVVSGSFLLVAKQMRASMFLILIFLLIFIQSEQREAVAKEKQEEEEEKESVILFRQRNAHLKTFTFGFSVHLFIPGQLNELHSIKYDKCNQKLSEI